MDVRASIEMPVCEGHPNRVKFEGCLTLVDEPSDSKPLAKQPHEEEFSHQKRVILTRSAAEAALPTLMGMAVNCTPGFDGHGFQTKIGIITSAWFEEQRLMVGGFLFGRDFPREMQAITDHGDFLQKLGMSYEMADAQVLRKADEIWQLTRVTFTGAAILRADRASYRGTSFRLLAAG